VDEQEHSAGPEEPGPAADGATAPLAAAAGAGQRPGRGAAARRALASRSAGWMVAALLAGVLIGLSVSFARSTSTVAVVPAGAARQFTIGPAGVGPGAAHQIVVGPGGAARQIVVGPGGAAGQTVVGPGGPPGKVIVVGPGGMPRKAVVFGPGGVPRKAVVFGPGSPPARAVVIMPAGGPLQQLVPPGVPVRVALPGFPPAVSWQFVNGQTVMLPAGVQVPATASLPPGMMAGLPAQVMVPPGQLRASVRIHGLTGWWIVPPAWQGGPQVAVPACLPAPQSTGCTIP
jgi:hypothetical protein